MATAEQMQEAFQQQQHELQVLTARVAAMASQLQFETARAHQVEQERSKLVQSMGSIRTDRGSAFVDTKGIGQPLTLKGTSEQILVNGPTKCGRSCLQGSEMRFSLL